MATWESPDRGRILIEEGAWTPDTEDLFHEVVRHLWAATILGFGIEIRNVQMEESPESLRFAPTWQYRIYHTTPSIDVRGEEMGL